MTIHSCAYYLIFGCNLRNWQSIWEFTHKTLEIR